MMGTESEAGLYLLAAQDIYAKLRQPAHAHLSLVASSYEIYGSKVLRALALPMSTPMAPRNHLTISEYLITTSFYLLDVLAISGQPMLAPNRLDCTCWLGFRSPQQSCVPAGS